MVRCSNCNSEMEKGTGMMYVRKNGNIKYFCTSRCYQYSVVQNRKPNKKEIRQAPA